MQQGLRAEAGPMLPAAQQETCGLLVFLSCGACGGFLPRTLVMPPVVLDDFGQSQS
jgi:hypothetical protein